MDNRKEQVKQLKEKICEVVTDLETQFVGIAFSGGVDSTLLAKICQEVGKDVKLLTIGFSSQKDILLSKSVSKALILPIFHDIIHMEDLSGGLKIVLSVIDFDRFVRLENCICFYYVFRLASKLGIHTILSANGMDELFCGYYMYKEAFGDKRKMRNLMKKQVKIAKHDKKEIAKLSELFGIEYVCPFLSEKFVDFAMKIPLEFKIKSENDAVRKHILREVAFKVGVPQSVASRPKKAFQYSSGLHRALFKLARKEGFNRKDAKIAGFNSEMEAYLETLNKKSYSLDTPRI